MIIRVHAKPGSRKIHIQKIQPNVFKVFVTAPPAKGLANMAIRKVLCDYFKVAPSCVILKSGSSSAIKNFEVTSR